MRLTRDHKLRLGVVCASIMLACLAATRMLDMAQGAEDGLAFDAVTVDSSWIDEKGPPSWLGQNSSRRQWPPPAVEPRIPPVEPRIPPVEPLDFQQPRLGLAEPPARVHFLDHCEVDGLVRAYYLNDQRIQWSGQETSFGVEAVLAPVFRYSQSGWNTTVESEFYFNQPINRNIYINTPERASYAANFDVDSLEISKLFLACRRGNLLVGLGKMETPFGRTDFPLFSNARLDAPFIRTESILWRETGMLLRYDPGCLAADVALTNGCEDRDTNSSKALVSRLGIKQPNWTAGISLKLQDGIGSENQKQFNNHVGADFMVRRGPFSVSGEVIHDEYGFRRPGFDPLDMTWRRSIYYRDRNYRDSKPISGLGYYLNVGYRTSRWEACLNYGEYHPQSLGDPRHDTPNRRGIAKFDYYLTSHLGLYAVAMMENGGYLAQANRPRRGTVILAGLQWVR